MKRHRRRPAAGQPVAAAATSSTARAGERRPAPAGPPPVPAAAILPGWHDLLMVREPYLIPLAILLVTRLVAWLELPMACEDAYITFRYAWNLATGTGLVYNPGERVMGFSSPLWTMWMAAGIKLLAQPLLWSRATALAADVVTLLVSGRLIRRHAGSTAAWCFAVFFAGWPTFAAVSVSGMESSVMLCLIALGAALTATRRAGPAGVALGALALIRPEGVAAAAVLAIRARRRDQLIAAGIFLAGLAALWAYFGTVVPQSVIAKAKLYGTPGPWAGRPWWEWLSPIPPGRAPQIGEGRILYPLLMVFGPAAVLGARELWRRRTSPLAAMAAAALVVWLGYAVLGVAYFFWYLMVPLAGLAVLAALGLPRLTRGRALLVACGLYVLAGSWVFAKSVYIARSENEFYGFGGVAEYLRQHCRPGDKVMLEPIGIVGASCPVRIVDEVGLVSPAVAERRLAGPGWYTDTVAREEPEWLVVRRGVLSSMDAFAGAGQPFRSAAERDSLLAGYRLATVADEASGERALAVLRRVR